MYYLKISVILAVLIMAIIFIAVNLFVSDSVRKGREGERRVAGVLKRYAKKNHAKVINNIYLPLYEKTSQIDHIVFGSFGVAVIETKNMSGKITGRGEKLKHTVGKKVYEMYNPNYQNKTHANNLKYHLFQAGYKGVPIYEITVFVGDDIEVSKSIGIHVKELMPKLCSLPDKSCDYKGMYEAVWSRRVTSPIKKLMHKHYKH